MAKDKYSAVWVSHTSISDWLECPRAYFLKNVYKDPQTGHKIQVTSPPLALGQAVHAVLEGLSVLPTDKRFGVSLLERLDDSWKKISGKMGGFVDSDTEYAYKQRAQEMLRTVMKHPGPLEHKAVKINMDLPYFWLSEEENIILCGKIDWLEYFEDTDEVHIIDFKTGKGREKEDSLQLPIYYLLVLECQKRVVQKASYWYLEGDQGLVEQSLPDEQASRQRIYDIALKIKIARKLDKFDCPHNGCRACAPYERILNGEGTLVGVGEYNHDVYILPQQQESGENDSIVL